MEKNDRIRTGEIMEALTETAGWHYITKLLDELIKNNKEEIIDMANTSYKVEHLNHMKAMAATVKAYEYIKNIPDECIATKNREIKGETNRWQKK